jgi:hypothetical protein
MDLMGMLNQAIASSDTEADTGMMGSLLGALNNAPVDNSKIGAIAGSLQGVLQAKSQGNASSLMGELQQVAATGAVEKLLTSDQVMAIAQRVGVDSSMVQRVTPLVAQVLVKGSNAKGGGLLQRVISGEVDLGQMTNVIGMANKFL